MKWSEKQEMNDLDVFECSHGCSHIRGQKLLSQMTTHILWTTIPSWWKLHAVWYIKKINNCWFKEWNYKVAVLLWSGDLYFQGKSLTHFFAGDSPQWRATRGPERKARMAPWSCMGWWLCSPSLTCLTYFPLAGLSSVHREEITGG